MEGYCLAMVSASAGCLRREVALSRPRAPACSELSRRHQPGYGQFLRGQAREQPGHRRLAFRMTGCFLDDLPQAVPRSGMGALIAAQGGRALAEVVNRACAGTRCGWPALDQQRRSPADSGTTRRAARGRRRCGPGQATTSSCTNRVLPGAPRPALDQLVC